ncbi:MAG: BON domain-containing protein [Rubrivivax sp.]|nr:BON domain-containing protein [Rubrivivax sp.]
MQNPAVSTRIRRLSLVAAAVAVLGLAACGRPEPAEPTVGQQVGTAIDKAGQMASQAGDTVADAVITAAVAAELALDKDLSALKVDIQTTDGRVALHGTAPSADARDRATLLAEAVKGVRSVDNRLTVVAG